MVATGKLKPPKSEKHESQVHGGIRNAGKTSVPPALDGQVGVVVADGTGVAPKSATFARPKML